MPIVTRFGSIGGMCEQRQKALMSFVNERLADYCTGDELSQGYVDADLISLTRQLVNTPHPAMQSGQIVV
jgi:hypothetical protein